MLECASVEKDYSNFCSTHEKHPRTTSVVATIRIRKICSCGRKRGRGTIWNTSEHSVLNKAYPQRELVCQSLTCWGIRDLNWPGREILNSIYSSPRDLPTGGEKLKNVCSSQSYGIGSQKSLWPNHITRKHFSHTSPHFQSPIYSNSFYLIHHVWLSWKSYKAYQKAKQQRKDTIYIISIILILLFFHQSPSSMAPPAWADSPLGQTLKLISQSALRSPEKILS